MGHDKFSLSHGTYVHICVHTYVYTLAVSFTQFRHVIRLFFTKTCSCTNHPTFLDYLFCFVSYQYTVNCSSYPLVENFNRIISYVLRYNYTHICIYTYMYTYKYVYVCACVCVCVYICMYVCVFTCHKTLIFPKMRPQDL